MRILVLTLIMSFLNHSAFGYGGDEKEVSSVDAAAAKVVKAATKVIAVVTAEEAREPEEESIELERIRKQAKSVLINFNRPRPKVLAKKMNIKMKDIEMASMKTPSYPSGSSCPLLSSCAGSGRAADSSGRGVQRSVRSPRRPVAAFAGS